MDLKFFDKRSEVFQNLTNPYSLKSNQRRWCINNQKVILPLSPFLLRRSCPYPDGNRHAEIGHDIHGSDAGTASRPWNIGGFDMVS